MASPILKGQRPNAPSSFARKKPTTNQAKKWGLIPQTTMLVEYDTTFHHNIPWETLRVSWNAVYAFCDAELVDDLFYLYHDTNRATPDPAGLLNRLMAARDAAGLHDGAGAATKPYKQWLAVQNSPCDLAGTVAAWNKDLGVALQVAKTLKGCELISFDPAIWKVVEIGGQKQIIGQQPLQYHVMAKRQFEGGIVLAQAVKLK
jgi:hypothetical protein